MDEVDWSSCEDPCAMLGFLRQTASERKMRLFVAACARDMLTYRPAAAEEDGGGSIQAFKDAIDRVEGYVDGRGSIGLSWIWVERDVFDAAFAVVGFCPDTGLLLGDPLEAIKDFRINPAHWLRDIFGLLPFRSIASLDPKVLAWNGGTITNLAQAIYDEHGLPDGTLDRQRLANLADILEEAGCTDRSIPSHFRSPGPHVRGCWALDQILSKQ